LNLIMDRFGHLFCCVSLCWYCIEVEDAGIFAARETAPLSYQCNALITHQRSIEPGSAAFRKQIGKHVINRIVGIAEVRPMVALNIDWLARIVDDYIALRCLPWFLNA